VRAEKEGETEVIRQKSATIEEGGEEGSRRRRMGGGETEQEGEEDKERPNAYQPSSGEQRHIAWGERGRQGTEGKIGPEIDKRDVLART